VNKNYVLPYWFQFQQTVLKARSGWWVEPLKEREEWKSALTDCGALSVIHIGTVLMLRWFADS